MAAGAAACGLSLLTVCTGISSLLATVLFLGAFLLALRSSPRQQVVLLIVALQLNVFSIEFGDRLYDPEHFYSLRPALPVAVMLVALLIWRVLTDREKLGKPPLVRVLVALDLIYWFTTLIHRDSPYFFRGLVSCTLLAVNVGIFLIFIRPLLTEPGLIDRACRLLITLYTIYVLVCIGMLAINLAGLDPQNYLVEIDTMGNWTMAEEGSNTPVPRPLSFEPNSGSQMAAICLLALAKSFQREEKHRYRYLFCAGALFIGVALTFARGAWVGLGAGLIASLFILGFAARQHREKARTRSIRPLATAISVVVISCILIAWMFPFIGNVLVARLFTLSAGNWQRGTMFERFLAWSMFIQEGIQSPILGHGADSYRRLIAPPRVSENFIIESFHVAGIWGPLLIGWIHVVLLQRAWRAIRGNYHLQQHWLLPLLCGYSAMIVAAQMNPSMWGGFYWMLLAILTAAIFSFQTQPERAAAMRSFAKAEGQ